MENAAEAISTPEVSEADQEGQHTARARRTRKKPAEVEQAPQQEREPGDDGETETRRKWTPDPNPHGFEGLKAEGNRVHLLKSELKDERGRTQQVAWVIRFDVPPNQMEGYSKENPHPVLQMLKDEGFRWAFDPNDDKGGHGKICVSDPYGTEHMDARRVLEKARDMIGAPKELSEGVSF